VGILYLTVFGALRLYSLLTPALAFPLLVAVAVLAATAAVAQNSLSLALIGVAGGFLAPVLASSGQGSHVVLFSLVEKLVTAVAQRISHPGGTLTVGMSAGMSTCPLLTHVEKLS
jgi:uncharacterized membrane protein